MFKHMKNKELGITLIALVVTIIVLLILAGISISTLYGNNGIINQARYAKDTSKVEEEKEIIKLALAEAMLENQSQSINEQVLSNALSKYNADVTSEGANFKIKLNGNFYIINQNNDIRSVIYLEPTNIYWRFDISNNTLYLRSSDKDQKGNTYTEGMNWSSHSLNIQEVTIEEQIAPVTASNMFYNCTNLLKINNIQNLHTENIINMEGMFNNCAKLESLDLAYFDTSKVVNMSKMFYNCINLKFLDVSSFNTSNVLNMNRMFAGSYNSNGKMTLENIYGLNYFKTSKVKDMGYMFSMCINLKTIDVSSFDTKMVEDMSYLFSGCWADARVEMKLEEIIGLENFKTSNVKNMSFMFHQCTKLKRLDLKNFDTSEVRTTSFMFCYCNSLQYLDISNFDTTKVTEMNRMFQHCKDLETLDISGFNTSIVNNMETMFAFCPNLTTIYASENFITTQVTNSTQIFYSSLNIVGGAGTKSGYNDDISYAHIDGGKTNPGYFTLKQ